MTDGRPLEPDARQPVDLPYRLAWRSTAIRIGAHRGTVEGSGGLFRDYVSLLRSPDPRRIDLRSSLRDPFDNLYVKRFEQKSAITLYALVDLSGSMDFVGSARKMQAAADICATLAAASRRIGDSFGLIGCDSQIVPQLFVPATTSRGGEAEMLRRLRAHVPSGRGAEGLIEAAAYLTGRRKLVFLISDFYLPQPVIESIFESLAGHDIVPLVLRDPAESEALPAWGLISLRDLETGRRGMLAMRPSLRDRLMRQAADRLQQLRTIATRYGRPPHLITMPIDWDRFAEYLMETAA